MKSKDAIKIISDFKENNLKEKLKSIKKNLIEENNFEKHINTELFEAAKTIKKLSSQIDEIVHAVGIINCLPNILLKNEKIIDLSLASGAEGEGFDLITTHRIAEFKFSNWQEKTSNGMRKRQVFNDFVNLLIIKSDKNIKKQLYVESFENVFKYFSSSNANWENVLSRNNNMKLKLEEYLSKNNINTKSVCKLFEISNIEVLDVNKFYNS